MVIAGENAMNVDRLQSHAVILISANFEWEIVKEICQATQLESSPFGEWFDQAGLVFFQGGWGKISAAASAQYALDQWKPQLLINLGTCGGYEGRIQRGEVILAEETIVYDIYERMIDPDLTRTFYTTQLDLSWLKPPFPQKVVRTRLISADQDLEPAMLVELVKHYDAVAGDWESGAIAWTAQRNQTHCLILRAVSDLVTEQAGEAYGDVSVFHEGTRRVMATLIDALPGWLRCAGLG
jgi:adenosylhomocysteine nucleosidase